MMPIDESGDVRYPRSTDHTSEAVTIDQMASPPCTTEGQQPTHKETQSHLNNLSYSYISHEMPIQLHNTTNTSVAFRDSDRNSSRRFYGYVAISERMNQVSSCEKVPFYIAFLTYIDICKHVLIAYIKEVWHKFILPPGSDSEQNRNVWQKSK